MSDEVKEIASLFSTILDRMKEARSAQNLQFCIASLECGMAVLRTQIILETCKENQRA